MSTIYDYTVSIGGKSHKLTNDDKSDKSSSFDISTNNQTIRFTQKMGGNKDYNLVEEILKNNPF